MRDGSVTAKLHTSTVELSRRIIRDYLRGQWRQIAIAILCMMLVGAATGSQAKLVEPALDLLLVEGNEAFIWIIPLGFLAAAMIKGCASYVQAVLMLKVGLRMIVMLQDQMFNRIVEADLAYIHRHSTGRQMTRFTNDVSFLRDAIVNAFTGMGREAITLLVLAGVMLRISWKMAVLALVIMPISGIPILYIGRKLRKVSANTQESIGSVASYLDAVLKADRQVKAYGTEA